MRSLVNTLVDIYLGSAVKVVAKLRAAIAANLLKCKDRCGFVLFLPQHSIVPPFAVMSVRHESCLAQASLADL